MQQVTALATEPMLVLRLAPLSSDPLHAQQAGPCLSCREKARKRLLVSCQEDSCQVMSSGLGKAARPSKGWLRLNLIRFAAHTPAQPHCNPEHINRLIRIRLLHTRWLSVTCAFGLSAMSWTESVLGVQQPVQLQAQPFTCQGLHVRGTFGAPESACPHLKIRTVHALAECAGEGAKGEQVSHTMQAAAVPVEAEEVGPPPLQGIPVEACHLGVMAVVVVVAAPALCILVSCSRSQWASLRCCSAAVCGILLACMLRWFCAAPSPAARLR